MQWRCGLWDKQIPFIARVTIDWLVDAAKTRTLYLIIRKRWTLPFDHIMRKDALESIVVTGKISGKRDTGRPKEIMLGSLRQSHGKISPELVENTTDWEIPSI